jgi:DNA-binding NtrC family response regulator
VGGARTEPEAIVRATNGRAPTVLVVDDDPAMRALLRDCLERAGYRVLEEPSGERLLAAVGKVRFDIVILDKEMSEPGGFEVLPDFRRRCPQTPVILITAFGGSRVAEEALRLGAYRYLEKPFQLSAILQAVQDAEQGDAPASDAGDEAGSVSS